VKKTYQIRGGPKPIGPYSHAVEANGLIFLSGQLGIDPVNNELVSGGVIAETEQIMKNIVLVLNGLGLDISDIVKSVIFFTNIDDFSKINEVYGGYFTDNFPARSAVEVSCLAKNAKVEIEIVASR
jgi:2-iminobutanoate/2-iminopropanoate deaminase